MGKKSIRKNYLYNLVYQILILVLPIITTPYLSRVLGAEGIGIYSYTTSIVMYFTLLGSLGLSMYGQREIAYAGESKKTRGRIFWEMVFFRWLTMAMAMVVYFFSFMNQQQYQVYYQILFLQLLANAFDISWFFQGMEEFRETVSRNIMVRLVSISLVFLLVKNPQDLGTYILIYSLADLLGNLSLWLYLPKYLKGSKVNIKNISLIAHVIPVIMLFIPQIASQIYNIIDKTMIGAMVQDKSELGYYEQAQKVVRVLVTIVTSLGIVMVPRIASIFASGDKKELNCYLKKSFNTVFLLAFPMMFGLISVSKEFIPIFLGEGYEKSIVLVCILAVCILLTGIDNVIGTQYLLPTKKQKQYTFSILAGLIVDVILNFILIKPLGAMGVSIATVIAQVVVVGVQMHYVKKQIKLRPIIRLSRRYFLSGLIMFGACMIPGMFIHNLYLGLVVKVIVGVVVYIGVLILLRDPYVIENMEYGKNLLKRFLPKKKTEY